MKSRQNIFVTFLDLLKVKHTQDFSSKFFNEHPHKCNLIAARLNRCHPVLDTGSPEQVFTDWFEKGKALKEAFFDDLQLNMENPEIEDEFKKHKAWKEKSQLSATPTILVNGYKLPDNYKIEDMRFLDIRRGN